MPAGWRRAPRSWSAGAQIKNFSPSVLIAVCAPSQLNCTKHELSRHATRCLSAVEVWLHAVRSHRNPPGLIAQTNTITAKAVHYNPLRGFPNFKPILDSFVKLKTISLTSCRSIPLPLFFSSILLTVPQMVSSSFDPFLPTAAELAGDAPADGTNTDQPSERQACHLLARREQPAY
eukprot:scaffold7011_cov112-Isochrysis_galbana.AAC.1